MTEIGWQAENRNDKVGENRGRVRLSSVNLGTGVFLWLEGDVKEEATVLLLLLLLAKSLHYGLFAHLAQSIASSIWNPARQSVYYSSPIWCSQQKNIIVLGCACPALSPAHCLSLQHTAETVWHHTQRCNVTWQSISSGAVLSDNLWLLVFMRKFRKRLHYHSESTKYSVLQWEQAKLQLNYRLIKKTNHWFWSLPVLF